MSHLRVIEDRVTDLVTGGWAGQSEEFRRAVLALWNAKGGNLTRAEVKALAASLTLPRLGDPKALLLPAAKEGDARVPGKSAVHLAPTAVQGIRDALKHPAAALNDLDRRLLVANLDSLPELLGAIQPIRTATSDMQAAASWSVHTAANEATVSAARQMDKKLVFIPERDACLRCIPHGGEVYPDTEVPPIHPRCRCELGPFEDDAVPAALRRESVRSVLRGFSLPSESEAARLRAARDLLGRNPVAPESVKAYARAAIRRGKFGRGRGVPNLPRS